MDWLNMNTHCAALLAVWLTYCATGIPGGATPPGVTQMTGSFTNQTAIALLDDGPAEVYPSSLVVQGMTGLIAKVTVTLVGLSHTFPDDLDVLIVSPGGQRTVLMSDAGGSFPVEEAVITFEDGLTPIPNTTPIESASYAPANWGITPDVWDAPAPNGPHPAILTNLNGGDPNGTWNLYLIDDTLESIGFLSGGWRLTVTSEVILPELTIARVGQIVELSWPAGAEGASYTLMSRSTLDADPGWTAVTNQVEQVNGRLQVTIPVNDTTMEFFRLEKLP
jgi:subtilisin-like proprotein convertase family protein